MGRDGGTGILLCCWLFCPCNAFPLPLATWHMHFPFPLCLPPSYKLALASSHTHGSIHAMCGLHMAFSCSDISLFWLCAQQHGLTAFHPAPAPAACCLGRKATILSTRPGSSPTLQFPIPATFPCVLHCLQHACHV